jgi:hypothetical protein
MQQKMHLLIFKETSDAEPWAVKKFRTADVVDQPLSPPPSPSRTTYDPRGTCLNRHIMVPYFVARLVNFWQFNMLCH